MALTFDLTFSRKGGKRHCKWFRIPTISCFLYLNFLWYLKKPRLTFSQIWNAKPFVFQRSGTTFRPMATFWRTRRGFETCGVSSRRVEWPCTPMHLSFPICRGSKISLCLRKKNKNKNGYKQNKIKRPSKLYLAMFQLFGINMQTFWHFYSVD